MKKTLVPLFAMLSLLWSLGVFSQTLVLHLANGSTFDVPLSSSFRMYNVGDKTIVSLANGSTNEFTQSDILAVTYRETRGDVNRDNTVDVADISAIISIMAGQELAKKVSVTTGSATNITHNGAVVEGVIKNIDSPVNAGVLYGTSTNLSVSNAKKASTTSMGNFTVNLSNLNAGTTYYYCAFAETDGNYYYGETKFFKTSPTIEHYNRTVLVYVAGDNNLTANTDFFIPDLREMMQGTKDMGTNDKLILFIDNNKERPYFMQVEQGDTLRLRTMDKELNSSDAETLYEAMKYVIDNYEAEDYGLVLWGHADGWIMHETKASATKAPRRAYGIDYTGGRTWMNIPDMAKALSKLQKLKFIFADCCCFMCVENVYELRNCADYIIGSPAEIPGEGAPYHTIVPAMFSQDSTFYKQMVDKYYEQKLGGYNLPLVAVKTSELENLAQATATTLQSFATSIEPDGDGCRYPDTDGLIFYYDHTQYDIQDFIRRYAATEQYMEWKCVFDQAVPVSTYSSVWIANHVQYIDWNCTAFTDFTSTEEREGGLGMFVPQRDSDAANWSVTYRINLGISMGYLNETIKSMKWYEAAHLSKIGW